MKILIDQYLGIGDILYIQKIVKMFQAQGHEVFLPVVDQLQWLHDYLDTTCSHSDIKGIEFDKVYITGRATDYHKDKMVMEAKYAMVDMDGSDYINYIDIKRNLIKELELKEKLNITGPYRLVCPYFGTPPHVNSSGHWKMEIPLSDELQNVIVERIEGYNIFDWITVITEADEIYTTDTCILFLIEKYKCRAKKLVSFSRWISPPEQIKYMFSKDWEYRKDQPFVVNTQ
jgi:hypothetical protein